MDPVSLFKENSYVHLEGLVSPEITSFIYNYLILKSCTNRDFSEGNEQDQNFIIQCYIDLSMETLSTFLLDKISKVTQKKLCPTYTFSRVYTHGELLKPHRDRPSCEYSITINFGGDPWPIYFGEINTENNNKMNADAMGLNFNGHSLKSEIVMKPGDGIIYMGEKLVHWRNRFEGDHCAQAFIHYIDVDGPHHPEWAFDKRKNVGYLQT